MKNKFVLLASALLISAAGFAQKDQIKAAEKALKGGNAAEAVNQLKQAEGVIANATPAEQAQYNFVKGNALRDLAAKKIETAKNLSAAANSYQQVLEIEKTSGKSKYTAEAKEAISKIKNDLVSAAVDEGKKNNNKGAADLLHQVYEMDKSDAEKLYFAASYAVNAQDYDNALSYYEELKKLNYTGEGTSYYAKNVISDEEEFFGNTAASKADRDNKVRLKLHTAPRDEKNASRKGEIYKNIALILIQKGKTNEAKEALAQARTENPDDTSLMMAEADIYLKLEDFVTYKKIVDQVLQKNPNDADLLYNLGVIASKNDAKSAEEYYKKAIAIKPDYTNAYLNLAILKLDGEKKLIDEMNKLGTSDKDNKRYEVLKKQRNELFTSAIPYLEKAFELDPKNEDVGTTLMNVYGALEMTDKKKALKAKLGK